MYIQVRYSIVDISFKPCPFDPEGRVDPEIRMPEW